MRFIIKPIHEIISQYDELTKHDDKILTIFISQSKYKYDFSALHLKFDDVRQGEDRFISDKDCEEIWKIDVYKYDLILIGCDAGLSRSPAVASALFKINDMDDVSEKIRYNNKFYNVDVYAYIITWGERVGAWSDDEWEQN